MTDKFPIHSPKTAPEASKRFLERTQKNFGMIPNLEGVMASAPALLQSYVSLEEIFDETSLTPIERQVVYQTANLENTCEYCVPWHTLLSEQAGMSHDDIQALRDGMPLTDTKPDALRMFTRELILQRGKVSKSALQAFFNAGFTEQQALEVILGIAIKTMSNYTNSIAGTPLDNAVKNKAWQKPLISIREASI
ncbi:MAG: carboxymuconolactone decarboxylase family protein [Acidiferrobacterales bacterium]